MNQPLEKTTYDVAGVMAIPAGNAGNCARERLFVDGVELTN
ncbi:hypothetical protein BN8_p06750 (plasmid) [Fibrisoma limi BUZ 3]|uniref:Uncharacterized protein n=1 Tax=Fibrisoma limi BUZ 3 TaxID=1185876 RepID=I2GTW3_9BACT|nr:hypothetical protein [Fibrisoma limi]CCH57564.1 hypothetical protein BN8_p06750 [Fibrisoma limi BUZ 3]